MVDIANVRPNDYNPNDMSSEDFEAIVRTMEDAGRIDGVVLVREDPDNADHYIIVDGENRYNAVKYLGKTKLPVFVAPYDEARAKISTIAMNNLKGQNIPIKLARLLVDLHKDFDPKTIQAMTGLASDQQKTTLKLLDAPAFKADDGIRLKAPGLGLARPVHVELLLQPAENVAYTTAMKKALRLIGPHVTPLVGHEVTAYNDAMTSAMGIAGVKLRNVALAIICETFNKLPDELRDDLIAYARDQIMTKKGSDVEAATAKKLASDKKKVA